MTRPSVFVLAALLGGACGSDDPASLEDAGGPADASVLDGAVDAGDAEIDASTDGQPIEPLPDPAQIGGPLTLDASLYGDQPFFTRPPWLVPDVDIPPGFSQGEQFFRVPWLIAPSPNQSLVDGLGPLYHADSCLACHPPAGRAPSLLADGAIGPGILFRLARRTDGISTPDPNYGGQLQPLGVAAIAGEGTPTWRAEPGVSPDSPRPVFALAPRVDLYGTLDPDTAWGARLAPHLVGMGLLSRVPDETLTALQDPADRDRDGISGRAARLGASGALARFGWKSIHDTLRTQAAAAFAGDMGITSPDHPSDDCTAIQTDCTRAPGGGNPEISATGLDAVVRFLDYTGIPAARRTNDDPVMQRGNVVFQEIGCAACHRPALATGESAADPLLSRVTFHPYTDLLLHDMGPGLADSIPEADADPGEWRTPPLWGLGLVESDSAARFLHDGRAANLSHAILWHGGEAEASRQAFESLPDEDRQALLAFVRSL